jgi:peptidyl-prolyl cis-trans isomerase A (cyclophilin A)
LIQIRAFFVAAGFPPAGGAVMVSSKIFKRSPRRMNTLKRAHRAVCEALENRQLLDATAISTISPKLAQPANPANDTITLSDFFNDPNLTGTTVRFKTSLGDINMVLTDNATPATVNNFLSYVENGAYNNTIFHRNVVFSTTGGAPTGGSPENPADIVQGGGFGVNGNSITHIAVNANIQDEFNSEAFGNELGTIAMGLEGDPTTNAPVPNSASSEFFFNTANNASVLPQYTVFGEIIGSLSVVDSIAALPTADLSGVNSALNTLPVTGIAEDKIASSNIFPSNLVTLESASVVPALTYTVTSDNKTLVNPTLNSDNTVSFAYGVGLSGVADITITAASADGVTTATQTFAVTVPNVAKPTQAITANADTAPDIITQTTGVIHPLANDNDSLSAINPGTLTITVSPVNGTATIDPETGYISYVPNGAFLGTDSLQYTVRDLNGNLSSPVTVSINVVPPPLTQTIGTATAHDLNYTQPDGTQVHLSLGGGATAVITFASFDVQISNIGGHVNASGSGATVTDINITNRGKSFDSLSITSKTGTPMVGAVTASGVLSSILAPSTAFTGDMHAGGLGRITCASLTGLTITLGGPNLATAIFANTMTDTSISANGPIGLIKVNSVLNPSTTATIIAAYILSIQVPGEFDEDLNLSNSNFGMQSAKIGTLASGNWQIAGTVLNLTAKSAAAAWRFTCNNLARNLVFGGDVSSTIVAGAITSLTVAGNMTDAVVETDANFSAKFVQLSRLKVAGTITNSEIVAAGNIGSITATSLSDVNIYAGVGSDIVQNNALPASTADYSANATIHSVQLGKTGTFSNSRIAAGSLGSMQLGTITTSNGGTPDGIAAVVIQSVSAVLDSTATKLALSKAQLKSAAALAAYLAAKGITGLNDFGIVVIPLPAS